ncbi:unnamed protein product [Trichogramma brassicae]|uniref:Uncharacterized protein n=1 Tax=Trichogramma brassicae TaxID=86971 RepID=A0A6H5HXW6_9HYME|nr:unnamed protein product [Trichogramma brassicae]
MSSCFSEEDEGSGLPPFQKITALGFLRSAALNIFIKTDSGFVESTTVTSKCENPRIVENVTLDGPMRGKTLIWNETHEGHLSNFKIRKCISQKQLYLSVNNEFLISENGVRKRKARARGWVRTRMTRPERAAKSHARVPTQLAPRHQLQQQALVPQQQQLRTFSCLSNNCLSNNCSSSYCKCSNCKLLNCGNFCSRKSTITVVITAVVTAVVIVEDIADNPLLPQFLSDCERVEETKTRRRAGRLPPLPHGKQVNPGHIWTDLQPKNIRNRRSTSGDMRRLGVQGLIFFYLVNLRSCATPSLDCRIPFFQNRLLRGHTLLASLPELSIRTRCLVPSCECGSRFCHRWQVPQLLCRLHLVSVVLASSATL